MTPQPAPTVGRIVHYHPRLVEVVAPVGGDTIASACAVTGPFPALVTAVWDDGALALLAMRPGRDPLLSLDYVLDGERQGCWSWPPREPAPVQRVAEMERAADLAQARAAVIRAVNARTVAFGTAAREQVRAETDDAVDDALASWAWHAHGVPLPKAAS